MAYIGKQPVVGNFVKLDAITTSATTTFNLLNGGTAYFPQTANNCIVSLNGVIQSPTSAYTISGSTIIFSDALTTSDTIDFILVLGDVLSIGTPSDGTVTSAKLASGISGLISWQSVVTASTLTAVSGRGYFIDTTSNACTITLPASATAGDTIILIDYARKWGTNAVTINQNSLKFQGYTSPNPVYNTSGQSVTLVYSGATQGWIPTVDDDVTNEVPQTVDIDFLVIGGGGAGGYNKGGGGGAGGFRTSTQTANGGTVITITVGDGGTRTANSGSASVGSGSNSSISGSGLTTITSAGGGGGATDPDNTGQVGASGGSGGGGARGNSGGSGNTPSTSPSQGNSGGGSSNDFPAYGSGGGGGATGSGSAGTSSACGNGGNGTASSITGSSVTYAGGGGASGLDAPYGTGGTGGGGNGASPSGTNGTVNLGGGGGGSQSGTGGTGGKGVVILSMLTSKYSSTTTGSPDVSTSGSNTILKFTGSGSYTA
jgi:hypothetical protein